MHAVSAPCRGLTYRKARIIRLCFLIVANVSSLGFNRPTFGCSRACWGASEPFFSFLTPNHRSDDYNAEKAGAWIEARFACPENPVARLDLCQQPARLVWY